MRGLIVSGRFLAFVCLFVFAVASQAQSAAVLPVAAYSTDARLQSQSPPSGQDDLPPLSIEDRADLLEVRKQYQAAIAVYASVQQPSAAVWNKMGIAYQMMLDTGDAVRCYEKALKLEPHNVHVLNNLATVEDSLQEFAAAERHYRKALRLDPDSALILKNLGTNLLMQHQYGRGSDAYAQALTLDAHVFDRFAGPSVSDPAPMTEHGTANYFKARSCARAGLTDCALTHLRNAFNEGSATLARVANENDFEDLRRKPEFQQLLAQQKP